uniref:tRNA (guanine(9)-N(1))-methyltransferase n=1 Tax=Caenorhabditis japonica TaxID=281687 RepID=A0A8R1HI22_CAEJA
MSLEVEEKIGESTDQENPPATENDQEGMSKKQLRRQKYKVKWEEKKLAKRAVERARKKEKRAALKESGDLSKLRKRKDFRKMSQSNSKQRIVLDMSFDDLMIEKDQKRTVQQIGWCYTANRHMQNPFQFHVVGFDGPSRKIYDGNEHNLNQDIHLHREKLEDVFKPEDVVYLTSESENVLTELDDSKVYVIGGIVDHNSQKGLCHRIAQEKGFSHARLPLDEHLLMKTRRVLTINQVYEILVHFSVNSDWKAALLSIVPERKNVQLKEENGEDVKPEEPPTKKLDHGEQEEQDA